MENPIFVFRRALTAPAFLTWALFLPGIQALAGETLQPWDPGAEAPCADALKSALFIPLAPPAAREKLSFTVTEGEGVKRRNAPVRGGLPFKRGELADPGRVRLLDSAGRELPVQGRVTSFWPEGSVRWLCLDFLSGLGARETRTFTLEYGEQVTAQTRGRVTAKAEAGGVAVDTGRMQVAFTKGAAFSGAVEREGGGTTGPLTGTMALEDENGREAQLALRIEAVTLEESGPVQATVYLKGAYGDRKTKAGAPLFPFHAYARIYAETCRMEVIHSFGYNGDENKDFVKRYGLRLPVRAAEGTPFIYGGEEGKRAEAPLHKELRLVQARHDAWRLNGEAPAQGRRFGGWAALRSPQGHATVALRNAWQQWPVTIQAGEKGELSFFIYGAPEGERLDLRYEGERFGKSKSMTHGPSLSDEYGGGHGRAAGLLKISELVLDFEADPEDAGAGAHLPLMPRPSPERIAQTKALGHIGTYARARALGFDTAPLVSWAEALLEFPVLQHEANGMYGWVDWPDQADCRAPEAGKFELILQGGVGWSNGERSLLSYYFHYAAGGAEKYLHLGHAYALHTIGIDLEHPGGDQPSGTPHRHDQIHWRQAGEARQCGVRGWIADWWMTGHPEIRRILFDEYLPTWRPKPGPGPDKVVLAHKATAYNYPNLLAYLTDRDQLWLKHHKAFDAGIFEAASQGLGIPYSEGTGGEMTWQEGRLTLANCIKGRIGGYWCTYGGDDQLAEHASLFGYEISLKALRAWGESFWGEKALPPGFASYHSPEAGATAYYLLSHNPRTLEWLEKDVKSRTCRGQPLEWDSYSVKGSAAGWDKACGQAYGKNGFKICAALVYESIYALAAIEESRKAVQKEK